jgi:hypothetical protein
MSKRDDGSPEIGFLTATAATFELDENKLMNESE